jgi:hypothetical protein
MQKLEKFHEKDPIEDYILEFKRLAAGFDGQRDALLVSYFYQGLDDDIKDALVLLDRP